MFSAKKEWKRRTPKHRMGRGQNSNWLLQLVGRYQLAVGAYRPDTDRFGLCQKLQQNRYRPLTNPDCTLTPL